MIRKNVFYDSEFTGLTKGTSLISIALVTETEGSFYAEFSDFDRTQVDSFVDVSVLAKTRWLTEWRDTTTESITPVAESGEGLFSCVGSNEFVVDELRKWLTPLGNLQIWADHVSYDWVLFCELFGGALSLPKSIYYIPMDLCTWMACAGYDPDCDRVGFGRQYLADNGSTSGLLHNALYDAQVSMACYQRLVGESAALNRQSG